MMRSGINFRSRNMLHDVGFKLSVGAFELDFTSRVMSAEVVDRHLLRLYADVREHVLAGIRQHHPESCLALGYTGPFLAGQVDLTTVAGEEYITFSVSYIPPGDEKILRIGLATRAFPGSHTVDDVEYCIEQV